MIYDINVPPLEILDGFSTTPAGIYGITNPDHVATFQIGTATYAGISSDAGLTIVNITDLDPQPMYLGIVGTPMALINIHRHLPLLYL